MSENNNINKINKINNMSDTLSISTNLSRDKNKYPNIGDNEFAKKIGKIFKQYKTLKIINKLNNLKLIY
jgi:hypothetical protein